MPECLAEAITPRASRTNSSMSTVSWTSMINHQKTTITSKISRPEITTARTPSRHLRIKMVWNSSKRSWMRKKEAHKEYIRARCSSSICNHNNNTFRKSINSRCWSSRSICLRLDIFTKLRSHSRWSTTTTMVLLLWKVYRLTAWKRCAWKQVLMMTWQIWAIWLKRICRILEHRSCPKPMENKSHHNMEDTKRTCRQLHQEYNLIWPIPKSKLFTLR